MGLTVINKVNQDELGRSGGGFQGNTFDRIQTTYTLELDTTYEINATNQVLKSGNVLTLLSGSWSTLIAANNGASITFSLDNITNVPTTVNWVNGADMELVAVGVWPDGLYSIGFVQMTDPIEEVRAAYNLVKNSNPTGTTSLVDGSTNSFSCVLNNALTIGGGTDNFTQLGDKSGGSIFDTFTIERIADSVINGNKQYELVVSTKIWDFKESDYAGPDALGDFIALVGLPTQGDLSVSILATYSQIGNTGFENENFNGVPPQYTLDSIAWEDNSANSITTMDFSQDSKFTIRIDGASLAVTNQFNAKLFFVPNDATRYSDNLLTVDENLMLVQSASLIPNATPTNVTGNENEDGARCDFVSLEFNVTAGSHVDVTGTIRPNDEFKALYDQLDDNDRNFVLWIQCEDDTQIYKAANRVNVLADSGNMVEDIQPLGNWTGIKTLEMQNHNNEIVIGDVHLEDDNIVIMEYTLPRIPSGVNPWDKIRLGIYAENTVTGEKFDLEEFVYDVSQLPVLPDQTLLLDYTQNRGFKLPATSNKHNIVIERDTTTDTPASFGVRILYPFIVRYEDWLPLPQASNDFFGSKNNNWAQYANAANWVVKFEHGLERDNSEYVDDIQFGIKDYDSWSDVSDIQYLKEDLSTALNAPYTDQITVVRAIHTVDTEDWNGNEWAQIHVRPENGSPQWLTSTVLDYSDTNNPLPPLTGETKAKLTVSTKVVIIEARFDPSKIDVSGNLTFTTRVKGDTTLGTHSNVFLETVKPRKQKEAFNIRGEVIITEENRGYKTCGQPILVLADLDDSIRYKNDVTSAWDFGIVTFTLEKDGQPTAYTPTSVNFPNEPNAQYCTIEWRDVLNSDGAGCYTLKISAFNNNIFEDTYTWATYELKPYEVNGYFNAKYTARILAEYNDQNDKVGINFTDARVLDSIRFKGKFGYEQPNTEVDNVEYINGELQKVSREDFFDYELRSSLINKCVYRFILQAVRGENSCWASSYNYDDYNQLKLLDLPVIVKEGLVNEWIDGSKQFKTVIKFEDKIRSCRTHFQDNRQTAEAPAPPSAPNTPPPPIQGSGATLMQTGQQISYISGDDGDLRRGRMTDFLNLENAPLMSDGSATINSTTNRFTDELGGQTYANNIVIDWSTFNNADNTVLGYFVDVLTAGTFDLSGSISYCNGLNVGGFTPWVLPNIREIFNVWYFEGVTGTLNYFPMNNANSFTGANGRFLNTSQTRSTTRIRVDNQSYTWIYAPWANTYHVMPVRTFTVNGTNPLT